MGNQNGPFTTDDFFSSGSSPSSATAERNMVDNSPNPGANSQTGEFDALQARARLDRGETLEQVSSSYGITPRALKVRMTKLRNMGSPHLAARAAIGESSYTGPGAPNPAPEKPAPTAEQLEIERAIADFRKYITPEAIVDSIDGLQSSMTKMTLVLMEAQVTKEEAGLIPFDPMEKSMLKPWAAFSLANIETALRDNPSLGLQIFGVLLATMLTRRGILIAYTYKRRKMNEKRARPTTLAPKEPASADPNANAPSPVVAPNPQGIADEQARL